MNFNILKEKKNLPIVVSLVIMLLGCILPYYVISSKWMGTSVGGPLLITGIGVILVLAILASAYCVIINFWIIQPIVGIVGLLTSLLYAREILSWGAIGIGRWILLIGSIGVIIFGVHRLLIETGALQNGTLDFNKLKDAIPKTNAESNVDTWTCIKCGTKNKGKFCSNCGAEK